MKKVIGLAAGNLVVFGFLVFLGNFLAIGSFHVYNWFKSLPFNNEAHLLPNYQGAEWARTHFIELEQAHDFDYASYTAWRRAPFAGETINIDGRGIRRTYRHESASPERTIAFFGGSTTWGDGVDDDRTVPSEFVKLNRDYVGYNFGESGYVAHQGLNRFLDEYFNGFRPDIVVFYDGVNEPFVHCRRELSAFSHIHESKIRSALRASSFGNAGSFMQLVLPMKDIVDKVAEKLMRRMVSTPLYDCHKNPEKAARVARVLLSDWLIVKNLVESYGGVFVPVLQPVVYFSKTKTGHLDLSDELRAQYEAVYPLIVDMLDREFPELAANFMDLRDALDRDEYIYIDWCHLSPNGNELVAERISQGIAARTGKALAAR